MTKDVIAEQINSAPFLPFSVRTTDGRAYFVPSPDYIHLSPSGRVVTVWTHEGDGIKILDVALITELETSEKPS